MTQVLINDASLTSIANSIRAVNGETATYKPSEMPTAVDAVATEVSTQADLISQIQTALAGKAAAPDTSDATATAADILSGKTAYAQGRKITGNIESRDGSDLSVNGAYVLVPPGYYADGCQAHVSEAAQATPSISVDSAGKITASATQAEGYVSAGTKSATEQLTTQAAKTVTPTTADQTAVASGVYTTGAVTVKGDANLTPDNIKSGVSIFGVAGSYEGSGGGSGGGVETCTVNITYSLTKSLLCGYSLVYCDDDGNISCHYNDTGKNPSNLSFNDIVCGSVITLYQEGMMLANESNVAVSGGVELISAGSVLGASGNLIALRAPSTAGAVGGVVIS